MGASDAACGSLGADCEACDGTITSCVERTCRVRRPAAEVSLDAYHSCARAETGEARCYGNLSIGLLDGTVSRGDVELVGRFLSVTAFGDYDGAGCGVAMDGTLSCWGENTNNQAGVGMAAGSGPQPRTNLATGTRFVSVQGGMLYACALSATGAIYCWGNGTAGRLGLGQDVETDRPNMEVAGCAEWRSLSLAHAHTCAICDSDGLVYCWGDNSRLAVGPTADTAVWTPRGVPDTVGFELVRAGRNATCGIRAGELWCWGTGVGGDVVPGAAFAEARPTRLFPSESGFTDVSTGGDGTGTGCPDTGVTCAIQDGALYCWGVNCRGELGQCDGDPRSDRVRVNVSELDENDWNRVFVGENAVCAVKDSGALYCWGDNGFDQIVSNRIADVSEVLCPTFIPLD
jgi:alpha-tubulin suppressor-like RCC1 family protein